MSKLYCTCGRLVRVSGEVPNPREWRLVADDDLHGHATTLSTARILDEAPSLVRCPECGRLWVFWKGIDHPPTEYLAVAAE